MVRAVADTHAVVWYLAGDVRLSPAAKAVFDTAVANRDQIAFSSVTLAELIYLSEKGRIGATTFATLLAAVDRPGAVLIERPFDRHVAEAMRLVPRSQVPDLPDRIIAATALYERLPLISRDRRIRLSGMHTIW